MAFAVAATLAVATGASRADARGLRLVDVAAVGTDVRAQGQWITWRLADGKVVSYDVTSATLSSVPVPADCRYIDLDADGELLLACSGAGRVLSLKTGQLTTLPSYDGPSGEVGIAYHRLGRHWVELLSLGHKGEGSIFMNRATGAIGTPRWDARHQIDRDSPTLNRRLCRGFQRPREPLDYGGYGYGDLLIAGAWAASATYRDTPDDELATRVLLQRCGRPVQTLASVRDPVGASTPVIDDRIVAWWTGKRRITLRVQSLRRRVRRTVTLPEEHGGRLLLLAHRLYYVSEKRLVRVLL